MTGSDSATSPAAADLLIEAGWLVTVDGDDRVLADHTLASRDGRIVALLDHAEARRRFPEATVVDRRGCIVLPGLVNAHTHLAMNLLRGFADDLPLMTWLREHIWPTEARVMSAGFVRDGTALALVECLRAGVTCCNDMYFFPDAVAETCRAAGIRATVGLVVFDFPTAWARSVDEYFERGLALHDELRGDPLVETAFAPHAPYTVSRGPLERVGMLAAELERPIHIHVQETADEVRDFVATHGMRPLAWLDEIGVLGPALLAVHLTQLVDTEIARLAETRVNALHCPASNLKLASGYSPVAALLAAGVNVAVGTDGAASNNGLDLWAELRLAALLAKAVAGDAAVAPAPRALRMVTADAARALGRDAEFGSLEVGKATDTIAVEPDLTMRPIYDPVSQLVYATGRDRVRDVWIAGRHVLDDRRLTTLDTKAIGARCDEWADRIRAA